MVDGVCSVQVDVVMVMDEGLGVDGSGFGPKQVRWCLDGWERTDTGYDTGVGTEDGVSFRLITNDVSAVYPDFPYPVSLQQLPRGVCHVIARLLATVAHIADCCLGTPGTTRDIFVALTISNFQ